MVSSPYPGSSDRADDQGSVRAGDLRLVRRDRDARIPPGCVLRAGGRKRILTDRGRAQREKGRLRCVVPRPGGSGIGRLRGLLTVIYKRRICHRTSAHRGAMRTSSDGAQPDGRALGRRRDGGGQLPHGRGYREIPILVKLKAEVGEIVRGAR